MFYVQAVVNGDASMDSLSESSTDPKITNGHHGNSPLSAGEPPSPASPKLNGGAVTPGTAGKAIHLGPRLHLYLLNIEGNFRCMQDWTAAY